MNHIDEYDDLTAVEIRDLLSERDFSTDELRAIKTYEHENKDRITVRRKIDELLVSDTDVGAEATDEDDTDEDDATARTVETNTQSMSTNDTENSAKDGEIDEENLSPQTDDDAVENPQGDPDTVRVRLGRSGYAAGYQFDDALEEKEVAYNRRVELAIDRGTLERV